MYNNKILQIFLCMSIYHIIPLTFEIQLISHYKVNTNEVMKKWFLNENDTFNTESINVCFPRNDLENDFIVFYVHATDICKIKKDISNFVVPGKFHNFKVHVTEPMVHIRCHQFLKLLMFVQSRVHLTAKHRAFVSDSDHCMGLYYSEIVHFKEYE